MTTTVSSLTVSDASGVFLNTDDFAESCTLYPGGDRHRSTSFTGQVFRDDEEGTREVHGDGVVLNQEQGERVRRSITIDCLATLDIDDTRDPPDLVKTSAGEVFVVKRILGRDSAMQRVRCVRVDKIKEAYPTRRG